MRSDEGDLRRTVRWNRGLAIPLQN